MAPFNNMMQWPCGLSPLEATSTMQSPGPSGNRPISLCQLPSSSRQWGLQVRVGRQWKPPVFLPCKLILSSCLLLCVLSHAFQLGSPSTQHFQVKFPDFGLFQKFLHKQTVGVLPRWATGCSQSQGSDRNQSDIGNACYMDYTQTRA